MPGIVIRASRTAVSNRRLNRSRPLEKSASTRFNTITLTSCGGVCINAQRVCRQSRQNRRYCNPLRRQTVSTSIITPTGEVSQPNEAIGSRRRIYDGSRRLLPPVVRHLHRLGTIEHVANRAANAELHPTFLTASFGYDTGTGPSARSIR